MYFEVIGANGSSGVVLAKGTRSGFQKGQAASFTMEDWPDLGPLISLRVGHDNSGVLAGWKLEYAIVAQLASGGVTNFPCYAWLSTKEADGAIERVLTPGELRQEAEVRHGVKLKNRVLSFHIQPWQMRLTLALNFPTTCYETLKIIMLFEELTHLTL